MGVKGAATASYTLLIHVSQELGSSYAFNDFFTTPKELLGILYDIENIKLFNICMN